jgi:hypothetical protein
VIVVYWLEGQPPQSRHQVFAPGELNQALTFAESVRMRRRNGEPISHVSLQSELAESVGQAGVSDASADYAHYKRRIDPAIPLGRPSGSTSKEE